jgi:hypothetical protein
MDTVATDVVKSCSKKAKNLSGSSQFNIK